MKKGWVAFIISLSSVVLASLAGLMITGWKIGWGPFSSFYWSGEVSRIRKSYDVKDNQDGVVFYGASNFRLWTEIDDDLYKYKIVNAGFGGSTDKLMVQYANDLLYIYHPEVVFFQTGSNDYVEVKGNEEEKVSSCMAYKKEMFQAFHEQLPNTKFVIMSGLLLPGRSQYTELTKQINTQLSEYADSLDYLTFVDAEAMTYDNGNYRTDLFNEDGIHLNHTGQLEWRDDYILPCLKNLEDTYPLNIRK